MTTVTAATVVDGSAWRRREGPGCSAAVDHAGADGDDRAGHGFLLWGAGGYGVVLVVVLVACLRATGGHLVYVLDDPAIHLSVADRIVHDGTWGVEAGHFQSASSSPLWTALVAVTMAVSPLPDAVNPLVLNVAAAVAVVAVLGANQTVLRPSLRRPLDVGAAVVLVVAVLFLPGLTLVGMEHTLHMALVLGAVVLFHRCIEGGPVRSPTWPALPAWAPYALLALATLTRVETAFVAAGLATAHLAGCVPGWGPDGGTAAVGRTVRRAALVAASAAVPLGALAATTKLAGQGMLPSSILAKSQTDDQALHNTFLRAALKRLTADPLLAALVVLAVAALVLGWRQRRRYVFPAVTFVVAMVLHVGLARVGWYERYQAYLVALGTLVALQIAAEALPVARRRARPALAPLLVATALALTGTKLALTADAPLAARDTYEQRYQAARFLARYYDGVPVATGELGYVSLLHRGPVTDVLGLGDYEVLRERRRTHQQPSPDYWADLARRRGVDVVAVYPSTLGDRTPPTWVLAGEWTLDRRTVTAFEPTFQFWGTSDEAAARIRRQLREFADDLPAGVTVHLRG
jgi:hypothetical protein